MAVGMVKVRGVNGTRSPAVLSLRVTVKNPVPVGTGFCPGGPTTCEFDAVERTQMESDRVGVNDCATYPAGHKHVTLLTLWRLVTHLHPQLCQG